MRIRRAKLSDLDFILSELFKFQEFFNSKHSLFGDDDLNRRTVISDLITTHLFLISETHDEAIQTGFICGTLTKHFLNPKIRQLSELFWWVTESYRNTRSAAMLFNVFLEYGKENVDWIFMNLEENSPVKAESLTKRGFVLREKNYLLEN